jgi:hypothetical protein
MSKSQPTLHLAAGYGNEGSSLDALFARLAPKYRQLMNAQCKVEPKKREAANGKAKR